MLSTCVCGSRVGHLSPGPRRSRLGELASATLEPRHTDTPEKEAGAWGVRLCMPGEPPATTANGPQAPLLSPDGVAVGWTGCPGCGFTPG